MINFKIKLDLIKYKKYYPKCDLKSIINCPIMIKGKCIGVIIDYDLNTDEASGFLFDNLCFNFNQDKKIIQSIEIIQDHSDVFEVYKI